MLEYAKGNKDFRLKVAEPKMGKVSSNFELYFIHFSLDHLS